MYYLYYNLLILININLILIYNKINTINYFEINKFYQIIIDDSTYKNAVNQP